MSLTVLLGKEKIKEWLRRAIRSGRLPGSLIFSGPEGVGKRAFALELAKMLNCRQPDSQFDSCEECPACRRIRAGEFADVRVIVPEGQFIKIDQVREVVGEFNFRPFEGFYRVSIFDQAERLREQAANALLKTLEEPPTNALIILVTASPDALLPTIRSRAVQLRFAPLSRGTIRSYLESNYPRPAADTELLARLAGGSIGRAISIDLSQYREQRKECLELIELLLRRRNRLRLLKAAEYFGRKERAEFESRLELILALLRDLVCIQLGINDEVVNYDITSRLEELAGATDFPVLEKLTGQLTAIERDLQRNINRQLALETIFL
jgi:DNA polymerase III subunit delta'